MGGEFGKWMRMSRVRGWVNGANTQRDGVMVRGLVGWMDRELTGLVNGADRCMDALMKGEGG